MPQDFPWLCKFDYRRGGIAHAGSRCRLGHLFFARQNCSDPLQVTAGNFLRAVPFSIALSLIQLHNFSLSIAGMTLAFLWGALASALGYSVWHAVLPSLKSTTTATAQLAVPVMSSLGGVIILGEQLSWRLVLASVAILGA